MNEQYSLVPCRRADSRRLITLGFEHFPAPIARAVEKAAYRFLEFFTARIRNKYTRKAYGRAVRQFFDWCEERGLELRQLNPVLVAAYIEQHPAAAPKVKQHLAALRMLFDWLVLGHILPATRPPRCAGPDMSSKKAVRRCCRPTKPGSASTPLKPKRCWECATGPLIALMTYTFARVGALIQMRVEDYYIQGRKSWVHLREH